MFPLGTVLVPGARMPLHVFEPRYRALADHCMRGDRAFGVVLIERGSEVGGRDARFPIGTIARIEDAAQLPDGRWVLEIVGTERIEVRDWLPEDPYPRAVVAVLSDPVAGPGAARLRDGVEARIKQVIDLIADMRGIHGAPTIGLDEHPRTAAYQAMALPLVGDLDTYRLLCMATVEERLARLMGILDDEIELLQARA